MLGIALQQQQSKPSTSQHIMDPIPECGRVLLQVLQRRQGVNFRVNLKERGDVFGELALMYNCPRSATVAATTEAVVWVLERDVFR
jgi:CRP-like cAMP-binding protein